MKIIKLTAIILLLITLPIGIFADEKKPDVIQLDSGPISGKVEDGVRIFSGIPYAAPLIGELRWKPPQEIASWTQVRNSTDFSPSYLRDEALDLLRTPTDTEHNGLFGTVMVVGAAGMVYIFDENIRKPVREHGNQTLDRIANVGSAIGNPLVHIGMAGMVYGGGVLAGSQKWQETGKMLGEAVLLADAATLVLKESIGRGRPYVNGDKGSFKPLQFDSDYDSLPSMHTASSFAVASVMSGASESLWAKAAYYSAATFVGLSRMVDDQHWASDVILGAAIGELCGRIVARHHTNGKRKFVLAPIISGNTAFLGLSAAW